jgi:drug/metabolite transporter (DMT)-like permease
MQSQSSHTADAQSWGLLLLLSLIWGGSFLFIAIAVKELSALQIVFARVAIAAAVLIPIHWLMQGRLPTDTRTWIAAGGMSILNNIIPFTLITWGQHYVTGGLASVVNATTPMFAVIFMAMADYEKVTLRKAIALVIGLAGVFVLQGASFSGIEPQSLGIAAIAMGAAFYGVSAPWSKKMLVGIPPLTTATCQMIVSTILMVIIVLLWGNIGQYQNVTAKTWVAIFSLAILSTSLAYLIFFRIIARAGPSFVSLCTMIIPVSAILLGYVVLGEKLTANEIWGAGIIGVALLVIDGRLLRRFNLLQDAPTPRP